MRRASPPDRAGSPGRDDFDLCLCVRTLSGHAGWPRNNA